MRQKKYNYYELLVLKMFINLLCDLGSKEQKYLCTVLKYIKKERISLE